MAITDAPIKRGMLVLKPENITVLGGEVSNQHNITLTIYCDTDFGTLLTQRKGSCGQADQSAVHVRQVDRLEQARCRMVERWRQPPACSSGRNGANINLFAAATAAAWPQPGAANGGPGGLPQPPQLPAPDQVPERQHANGPNTNARISSAADGPPHAYVQESRDQGVAAQAARHAAASQGRSVIEPFQHAADGMRQQPGGADVIDVIGSGAHQEAAAASESSLDSWSDQAAALAQHRRKRARHSVLLEPVDDDDDDGDGDNGIESVEQAPQPTSLASAEDQQEIVGVREMPGHLTSLSQLEELRDEEYPASIRMHGGIVGLVGIPALMPHPSYGPHSCRSLALSAV